MTAFDEATAVRRLGPGEFETSLDRRFAFVVPGGSVPPAVNGGALMAAVLRAVLAESPYPHPVATSAHFLRVARLGPARITLTWLRSGGTAATVRAALEQDGAIILDTTVTTGTVPASPLFSGNEGGSDSGRLTWAGPPPDFPAAADCVELAPWRGSATPDGSQGYAASVRLLFDPATTGWRHREPSGCPEMRAYVGLRAERDPDVYLLALAVDALAPGGVRPRRHRLVTHGRADLAYASRAGAGPAAGLRHRPAGQRGLVRRGRRGLGRGRHPGGAESPAGPDRPGPRPLG